MITLVNRAIPKSVPRPASKFPASFRKLQETLVNNNYRPGALAPATKPEMRTAAIKLAKDCREFSREEYLRIKHAHVCAINDEVLDQCGKFSAIAYLPGYNNDGAFTPHPILSEAAVQSNMSPGEYLTYKADPGFRLRAAYHGTGVCEIFYNNKVPFRAFTLTYQYWKPKGINTWRLDAYSPWIDCKGRFRLGGSEGVDGAKGVYHSFWLDMVNAPLEQPFNHFNRYANTTELGMDMIAGVEKAVLFNENVHIRASHFPRLWYGIKADTEKEKEMVLDMMAPKAGEVAETPSMVNDIMWLVNMFLDNKTLANHHEFLQQVSQVNGIDNLPRGCTFQKMKETLGDADTNFIVMSYLVQAPLYFWDCYWLPADYIPASGSFQPWLPGSNARMIATFGPEALGREVIHPGGLVEQDYFRSKIQVIPLVKGENTSRYENSLAGETDRIRYDLVHVWRQNQK